MKKIVLSLIIATVLLSIPAAALAYTDEWQPGPKTIKLDNR